MAGRKPKPTGLKLVTGNPGKRKLNDKEPQPEGEVVKPDFILENPKASKIWEQYAPQLIQNEILTAWDCHTFGVWCYLMADFAKCPEKFDSARMTQMRMLASCFGLEPSSRGKFKLSGEKDKKDPAEKYFTGTGGSGKPVRPGRS